MSEKTTPKSRRETKRKSYSSAKEKRNSINNECFSPIVIPKSPSSQQGNLTETPRIISDIVADFSNNLNRWKDIIIDNTYIVKQIAALKNEALLTKTNLFPDGLEQYCISLSSKIKELEVSHEYLKTHICRIEAVNNLHKSDEVFFMSWPISKFVDSLKLLFEAYSLELKVKRIVAENIAHSKTEEEVMFHTCCWVYEIYINDAVNLNLEALLTETGHKSF